MTPSRPKTPLTLPSHKQLILTPSHPLIRYIKDKGAFWICGRVAGRSVSSNKDSVRCHDIRIGGPKQIVVVLLASFQNHPKRMPLKSRTHLIVCCLSSACEIIHGSRGSLPILSRDPYFPETIKTPRETADANPDYASLRHPSRSYPGSTTIVYESNHKGRLLGVLNDFLSPPLSLY